MSAEGGRVADLRRSLTGKLDVLRSETRGSLELAEARGYQGGYEQAIRDHKAGRLRPENALDYRRQSAGRAALTAKTGGRNEGS